MENQTTQNENQPTKQTTQPTQNSKKPILIILAIAAVVMMVIGIFVTITLFVIFKFNTPSGDNITNSTMATETTEGGTQSQISGGFATPQGNVQQGGMGQGANNIQVGGQSVSIPAEWQSLQQVTMQDPKLGCAVRVISIPANWQVSQNEVTWMGDFMPMMENFVANSPDGKQHVGYFQFTNSTQTAAQFLQQFGIQLDSNGLSQDTVINQFLPKVLSNEQYMNPQIMEKTSQPTPDGHGYTLTVRYKCEKNGEPYQALYSAIINNNFGQNRFLMNFTIIIIPDQMNQALRGMTFAFIKGTQENPSYQNAVNAYQQQAIQAQRASSYTGGTSDAGGGSGYSSVQDSIMERNAAQSRVMQGWGRVLRQKKLVQDPETGQMVEVDDN